MLLGKEVPFSRDVETRALGLLPPNAVNRTELGALSRAPLAPVSRGTNRTRQLDFGLPKKTWDKGWNATCRVVRPVKRLLNAGSQCLPRLAGGAPRGNLPGAICVWFFGLCAGNWLGFAGVK